jgi:hypothetical protein
MTSRLLSEPYLDKTNVRTEADPEEDDDDTPEGMLILTQLWLMQTYTSLLLGSKATSSRETRAKRGRAAAGKVPAQEHHESDDESDGAPAYSRSKRV